VKKFEQYINKVEMYFGDVLAEFAEADGYDEEQMCSGEWQPSEDIIKDCMAHCLCDFAGVTGDELQQCVSYWYKQNYG